MYAIQQSLAVRAAHRLVIETWLCRRFSIRFDFMTPPVLIFKRLHCFLVGYGKAARADSDAAVTWLLLALCQGSRLILKNEPRVMLTVRDGASTSHTQ